METATREVFGNIAPWMRAVFYAMMFASLGLLAWRLLRLFRLYSAGRAGGPEKDPLLWFSRLWTHVLRQQRVRRRAFAGIMHVLIFSGFVVLTIGTTLLFIADSGPVNFHHGWYYLGYELTMDLFGVALCVGCCMALYRRAMARPTSLGHAPSDWWMLGLLLALGLTGFLVEALRLHFTTVPTKYARWSIVAWGIQSLLLSPLERSTARQWHLALWWVHAVLVALFFATLPQTRMLHAILGPIHIAARPRRAIGALEPVSIEQVEATGRVGIEQIADLDFQQRLSLDACMECGRCHDACPARATDKPLSPMKLVTDLRGLMHRTGTEQLARDQNGNVPALHGQTILAETLWSCTMCQACVHECPVLIGHVDLISGMRRYLVGEGRIDGPPAAAMRQIVGHANPFGIPNEKRLDWSAGLNVPLASENGQFEYLLWVGCAASFDPRAQRIARALVQLLQNAKVSFAVLGGQERCTGDPARRIGDEFLFQESAQHNIELLNRHGVRQIVTPCPHCANTLGNEYPQFGGSYTVLHHSQLLGQLVKRGKLKAPNVKAAWTLHDPCYLARVLGQTSAPRQVLGIASEECSSTPTTEKNYLELARSGDRTFCCGAGGGRMWFDERPEQRVSHLRAREVVASGAHMLATACPFCLNMMTDGLAGTPGGQQVTVRDIAEILLENQSASPSATGGPA
jgi:Fe-S oxidoreductase/nitrate reductase gamma subunit